MMTNLTNSELVLLRRALQMYSRQYEDMKINEKDPTLREDLQGYIIAADKLNSKILTVMMSAEDGLLEQAKVEPGTALPWEMLYTQATVGVVHPISDPVAKYKRVAMATITPSSPGHRHRKDMAYIVHVANAYPKLIRTIKDLVKLESETETEVAPGCLTQSVTANSAFAAAGVLLQELGEAK